MQNNQILDRIFWHALTGAHARHASGDGGARRYTAGFSPIIAFADSAAPLMAMAHKTPKAVRRRSIVPSSLHAMLRHPAGFKFHVFGRLRKFAYRLICIAYSITLMSMAKTTIRGG